MAKYKKINGIKPDGTIETVGILKKEDIPTGMSISFPMTVGNSDYDEYLEWIAEGNTVEEADGTSWDDIRAKRNAILQNTDWTMTTGATVDQAQGAAYRQNIRDIPQTYSGKTPDDVIWPTQPSTAGPNT